MHRFSPVWLVPCIKKIRAATWMKYLILEEIKENHTFIAHKAFFF